jgi:hypothetical protein
VLFVGRKYDGLPFKTKMFEFDMGALRYFDIVASGIHADKPKSEDYLKVIL